MYDGSTQSSVSIRTIKLRPGLGDRAIERGPRTPVYAVAENTDALVAELVENSREICRSTIIDDQELEVSERLNED